MAIVTKTFTTPELSETGPPVASAAESTAATADDRPAENQTAENRTADDGSESSPSANEEVSSGGKLTVVEYRADRVVQSLTGLSRRQIQGLFDHGCVTIEDRESHEPARRLNAGESLTVRYDSGRRYSPHPPWRSPGFRLIYEDEDLLVVDKAPGFLTVPTPNGEPDTLIAHIASYLSRSRGKQRRRPFVVHRLDRGASGLLVFGKSEAIADRLRDQFELHKPQRVYLAIVAGHVEPAEGTLECFLSTAKNLDRYVTDDEEHGELAISHYEVLKRLPDTTLIQVRLETGRRNQIRVQFAELGHPVLGDTRYRPDLAANAGWRARRLALHAASLAFEHPVTGKLCRFELALPAAFEKFLTYKPRTDATSPQPSGTKAVGKFAISSRKKFSPKPSAAKHSSHAKTSRKKTSHKKSSRNESSRNESSRNESSESFAKKSSYKKANRSEQTEDRESKQQNRSARKFAGKRSTARKFSDQPTTAKSASNKAIARKKRRPRREKP